MCVTDIETKMCMDPEGNGAILNAGGEGGPGPPSGDRSKQLVPGSGDGYMLSRCWKTKKTGSE